MGLCNMSHLNIDPVPTKPSDHIYLLQVDTNQPLPTILHESQILPLQIINHGMENKQYFIPLPQEKCDILHSASQFQIDQRHAKGAAKINKLEAVEGNERYNCSPLELSSNSTTNDGNKISVDYDLHEKQYSSVQNLNIKPTTKIEGSLQNCLKHSYQQTVIPHNMHISDQEVLPRAVAVLPRVLLIRAHDVISPRRGLLAQTRFGPVQGIKCKVPSTTEGAHLVETATASKSPLFLFRDEYGELVHIDVSDKDKANWISLLPLGDEDTANLWLYEENHELYVITTNHVPCRTPLKLGYGKTYAEQYGLTEPPVKDLNEWSKKCKPWWCCFCKKEMSSAVTYQRHMTVYHKNTGTVRRQYRCSQCSMTFARLFTLRRHRLQHCKKKPRKSDYPSTNEAQADASTTRTNFTPNPEENRIPSDESFQNYSNGLDFSTNLFDTDRISSLDISGTLRVDEFNPYAFNYKDDNLLANELGFVNTCSNESETPQPVINESPPKKKNEYVLETCSYCNQVFVKEKRRLHVRQCVARRVQCKCGKVFTNKKLLAEHVYIEHPDVPEDEPKSVFDMNSDDQSTLSKERPYTCEQCLTTFKRRGMLVNHLWRVHNSASTNVPLVKKVLHYPCSECPKIYRTAAKRNRHMTRHHPGVEVVRGQSFEGGVRTCEPAFCPACPRQYNTRAKMLQHYRAHHTHEAPPIRKKSFKSKTTANNEVVFTEEPVDYSSSHVRMF